MPVEALSRSPMTRNDTQGERCSVTIGLVDASTHTGTIGPFSANQVDLLLQSAQGTRQLLAAERVAYIAYHRSGEGPASPPADARRYKIHVAGRKTFQVVARIDAEPASLGFTATTADPSSPFGDLFFYHHGVLAKEKDEPLGTLLLQSGALGAEGLARGLAAQDEQRTVPIGHILVEHRKIAPDDATKAAEEQKRRKMRIGEVLVEAGLVSAADIDAALAEQKRRKGKRLGETLVELGLLTEETLARALADKFHLAFVDLDRVKLDAEAPNNVPLALIEKYRVLPIHADGKALTIAIADPLSLDALDVLRFHTKRPIEDVLVTPTQLERYVGEYVARAKAQAGSPSGFSAILKELAETDGAQIETEDDRAEGDQADRGIISLVNKVIFDGYRRGASDIHVEPNGKEKSVRVRFRIDGDCVAYEQIPAAHRHAVVARIKIMASLDISERRKPQDGKIKFKIGDSNIELRVATIPTVSGNEDIVLRILASSKPRPLDKMGLSAKNLEALLSIIRQPYGLVLCVGPTGSGKTTTLHSALGAINTTDMKIWTAEDPVEITQDGLRQVQVHPKIGFTFASAMRSFLRADPDVIMVGEMRDQETAGTAVEASLTGHLVLSTLHTNSAPETITRLLDMGLDPFTFGDALLGVLAQRLARALCTKCRAPVPGTPQEYAEFDRAYGSGLLASELGLELGPTFNVWRAPGCEACGGTGYKGRVALHELLINDPQIRQLIAQKAPIEQMRTLAVGRGMRTLLQDGIEKCLTGDTDLKQVLAVCSR